jgi:hypothetical protein
MSGLLANQMPAVTKTEASMMAETVVQAATVSPWPKSVLFADMSAFLSNLSLLALFIP